MKKLEFGILWGGILFLFSLLSAEFLYNNYGTPTTILISLFFYSILGFLGFIVSLILYTVRSNKK